MRCGWLGDSHSLTKRSLQDGVRSALFAGIAVFSVWSLVLWLSWVTLKGPEAAPPPSSFDGCFFPLPGYGITPATEHAAIPGIENDPEIDSHQLLELTSFAGQLPASVLRGLAAYEASLPKISHSHIGKFDGMRQFRLGRPSPLARWMIVYETEDEPQYLAQLSAFGIEIGAVHRTQDQIDLISVDDPTQARTVARMSESRVYFVPTESDAQRIDRWTAKRAGVNLDDKILVQFVPNYVSQSLLLLERSKATELGLELSQIRRTVFKIRANGADFEFYVAEMIPIAK